MATVCWILIVLGLVSLVGPHLVVWLDNATGNDAQMGLFLSGFLLLFFAMTFLCLFGSLICRFLVKPGAEERELAEAGIWIGVIGVGAIVLMFFMY